MSNLVNEIVSKIQFARASKFLLDRGMVEQHFPLPRDMNHEMELIQTVLYHYLKRKFVGSKLRMNEGTFSLRLDGAVHRKAAKLREIMNANPEWRKWFEENHRELLRTVMNNNEPFRGGTVERREMNGKNFIYIHASIPRIPNYARSGMMDLLNYLDNEFQRDQVVADLHDQAVELIQGEVRRREEEKREQLRIEKQSYMDSLRRRLLPSTREYAASGDLTAIKLAEKMAAWCVERNLPSCVGIPATHANVVPIGTKAEVISPVGSREQGWLAVPTFAGYPDIPEGYKKQPGWGTVSEPAPNNARQRTQETPIVVEGYLFLGYDETYWRHLFPEHYDEILAATLAFMPEAEAEAKAEMERRAAESVDAHGGVIEAKPALKKKTPPAASNPALTDMLRAQIEAAQQEPTGHTTGIYRNERAIPLERYVAVAPDGSVHRFSSKNRALEWMVIEKDVRNIEYIRDFHQPTMPVERI